MFLVCIKLACTEREHVKKGLLQNGDTLVVWRLDRLWHSLRDLICWQVRLLSVCEVAVEAPQWPGQRKALRR